MATLKEEKNKRVKKTDKEKNQMLELFRQMYLIRQFELACGENYTKGNVSRKNSRKKTIKGCNRNLSNNSLPPTCYQS